MAGAEVGTIYVKVSPDLRGFYRELKAKLEAIEDSLKVNVPVEFDVDTDGLRQKVKAATKGLDSKVEVKMDVDKSPLDKLRMLTTRGNRGFGGGGGLPLGSFADTAALVAAVAAIAAPAVALLTGALAALPGVIAGIATPIAAIALGLDGIKEAAKVTEPAIMSLQQSIGGTFQDRLTPMFEKIASVLPRMDAPLRSVANSISDVGQSLLDTITSEAGLSRIEGTIGNISRAISEAAPGVGSLTNGLLGLAEGVSAKFPAVSQWFNKATDDFAKWVEQANADGSLDQAMDTFGEVGKGVLDIVGDIAKQGFEWLKDPEFGQSMKDFVADTQTLLRDVMPGLGGLFQQVSGFVNTIVPVLDKINNWDPPDWLGLKPNQAEKQGGALGRGLNQELDEALPKLSNVQKGFGSFPDMDGPDKPWFGGAIGRNLDELESNFGRKFMEGIDPSNLFGKGTGDDLWNKIKEGFSPKNLFGQDKDSLIGIRADDGWKTVVDFFRNTVGVGMAQAGADTGQQTGGMLGQGLGQGIQTAAPQVQSSIAAATAPLQQLPGLIQQSMSGIGAAVTGSMATVVSSVAGGGQQIIAAFSAALAQIPTVAAQAFNQVTAAAAAGMANTVSAITSGAAQAVAAVQNMAQQIIAAMQQAAAGAQAAGAQVGAGMAAGIRSSIPQAVAAARDMASQVESAARVQLGIRSPSRVFAELGDYTMQGFAQGMQGATGGVVSQVKETAKQIFEAFKEVFGSAPNSIGFNLASSGIQDFNTNLQSAASSVGDIQRSLGSTVNSVMPTKLDAGTKQLMAEIDLEKDKLEVQRQQLQNQKALTTDKGQKAALQQQIDQLNLQKDQLTLQKSQLKVQGQYTDGMNEQDSVVGDLHKKIYDSIKGVAQAPINQALGDLGISGQGALPQLIEQGIAFGEHFIFNVSNMDQAIDGQQRIQNKKALQYNTGPRG